MKKSLILSILFFACLLLFSVLPVSAQSSDKPRLAVFGFLNQTGDDSFTLPAETASGTLLTTMKLLSLFTVTEPDAIPRNITDSVLDQWCTKNNIDFVIFGTVSKTQDNKQSYQLDYFSRSAKKVTDRKDETGESVLDVFSIVDTLTGDMLGSIVNNKISFGSLDFANKGKSGDYDIYLDSVFIQTNPNRFERVPSGDHTVRIAQKATGKDILTQKVTIVKGKTEKLEFELKDETSVVVKDQQKGKARFESGTQGKIYIGQELIGDIGPDAPLVSDTLQTGSIDVRFVAQDGSTETKTITVTDKAYVTVAFGVISRVDQVGENSEQDQTNLSDINLLIIKNLPDNYKIVFEKSHILTDIEKSNLYSTYAKNGLNAFSLNLLFFPVSIGSFIQNDIAGGLVTSIIKVSGITGIILVLKFDYIDDPKQIGIVLAGSIGLLLGGEIGSLIRPWSYSTNYNNLLKSALRIPATVQVQPTVSFVPVNGAPGFMMGMNVKY